MSRDIRDASRENLLSRDILSRENFVSRRNLENLARYSRRFCKKWGKINLKRILCIHDCLPSYLYHFLTTKDPKFSKFSICLYVYLYPGISVNSGPYCSTKVSFDRSRRAELQNFVFGILPRHFGLFSGLRKLTIFQGRRFETRGFFFVFFLILPECCRKIPIYVKNYADFTGEGIIAIRRLVLEKLNFLLFYFKKILAQVRSPTRVVFFLFFFNSIRMLPKNSYRRKKLCWFQWWRNYCDTMLSFREINLFKKLVQVRTSIRLIF